MSDGETGVRVYEAFLKQTLFRAASAVDVLPDEIPVFWACGVTPQAAITQARPEFCMTHAPGAMLITDLLNHHLAV